MSHDVIMWRSPNIKSTRRTAFDVHMLIIDFLKVVRLYMLVYKGGVQEERNRKWGCEGAWPRRSSFKVSSPRR